MEEVNFLLEIIVLIAIALEIYSLWRHAQLERKVEAHIERLDRHILKLDEHIVETNTLHTDE